MKTYLTIFVLIAFASPALAVHSGKTDYNARCAGCHGANGIAQTEKAKALKMDVGKLALQNSRKSKDEMIAIIENGKGAMPGFKDILTRKQIVAIINYVTALRKK